MSRYLKVLKTLGLTVLGKPRAAQFAITNRCNGKCKICGIWKQKEKVTVSLQDGLQVIDRFAKMGVMQVTFTGGEPLINPHVFEFVKRAQQYNMYVSVCVGDPRLLTEHTMKQLHDSGSILVSMSFDTADPELNAELRGIPKINSYFQRAVDLAKKYDNIILVAAPTITEYTWDKVPDVIAAVKAMGFHYMNVSYPTRSLSKTFEIGGEDTSHISLRPEQISFGLKQVLHHLENGNDPFIINPSLSVKNMLAFLEDPKSVEYHCLGGWKAFAVDWFCDVYSCWRSNEKLGNMMEPGFTLAKKQHNACTMSWYRDFSVAFQDRGKTVFNHIAKNNFGKFKRLLY